MFLKSEDKTQKNLINCKRDEYRTEIRKQSLEERFKQKRMAITIQSQLDVSLTDVLKYFKYDCEDEDTTTKQLQSLFDLTAQSDSNKKIIFLDENCMKYLSQVLLNSQNFICLEFCFGILANLSTIEEYQNYNQKFIEFTIEKSALYLTQKTYTNLLNNVYALLLLFNKILIYIANLCDRNECLSNLFLSQNILNTLEQLSVACPPLLGNILYAINTIFMNASGDLDRLIVQAVRIIANGANGTPDFSYDILVTLSNVVRSSVDVVQAVMKGQLLQFLVAQLKDQKHYFVSLKIISDICAADDTEPIYQLICLGILDELNGFLVNRSQQIRKKCYLILNNMTYSNQIIIELIMTHPIFNRLINALIHDRQEDYTYVLSSFLNILKHANFTQYQKLIEQVIECVNYKKDFPKIVRRMLELDDKTILLQSIEAVRYLCSYGRELQDKQNLQYNSIVAQFKTDNIMPYLDKLQYHKSIQVFEAAQKLLVEYFEYQLQI